MADFLGPADAANSVTVRPLEARTFPNDDTWMKDCTSEDADDGTDVRANWFNGMIAVLRNAVRLNGRLADNVTNVVPEVGTDDDLLKKSMQHLVQRGQPMYAVDTGGPGALVIALTPTLREYKAGMTTAVKVVATNPGGATINIDGLGVKSIALAGGAPLAGGEMIAGDIVKLIYDGTKFQLPISPALKLAPVIRFAPGTYNEVVPPGVTGADVEIWGGGGGGGGVGSTGNGSASGGGGGGYARKSITGLIAGQTIVGVVGIGGGAGSTGGSGGDGATSTFGSYVSATPGLGGSANSIGNGGAAGLGAGGDVNLSGGSGCAGLGAGTNGAGGAGGGSALGGLGGGGAPGIAGGGGIPGGAGGGSGSYSVNPGGPGANGGYIIKWK